MESKIMRIFYGNDCLPYKDKARTVHYPIIGQAFEGASGTTEIHFYVDQIGGTDTTKWVSYAKLPSGKKGYKMLDSYEDTELNENYVKLTLSQFYTQEKGDVYISLNGFDGGVELEQDSDDNYFITGTPVIQATGSVKITMQYSVQLLPSDIQEYIELDDILAYISGKADVNYVDNNFLRKLEINPQDQDYIEPIGDLLEIGHDPIIYGIKVETESNYLLSIRPYQEQGQWVAELAFYDLYSHSFVSYEDADLDDISLNSLVNDIQGYGRTFAALDEVVLRTTGANKVYATNGSGTQANLDYGTGTTGNAIVQRDANGQVNVPDTPSDNNDATSKGYVLGQVQTKQDLLVSGTNIKTINNESILGSGNIDIQGGGGNAEWGSITGNIADQTDLQNEFQNVREVAEGKCKSIVVSYADTYDSIKTYLTNNPTKKIYLVSNGSDITSNFIAGTGYGNASIMNSSLNSNSLFIPSTYFLAEKNSNGDYLLYQVEPQEQEHDLKTGDIVNVIELYVPDRWFDANGYLFAMETSKVDLSGYATKSGNETITGKWIFNNSVNFDGTVQMYNFNGSGSSVVFGTGLHDLTVDTGIFKTKTVRPSMNNNYDLGTIQFNYRDIYFSRDINPNSSGYGYTLPSTTSFTSDKTIASVEDLSGFNAYSSSQTYAVGDKVVYGGKLYRCTTAITTAESWDSTHWTEITLSDYVDTFSDQTISCVKTFNNELDISNGTQTFKFSVDQWNELGIFKGSTQFMKFVGTNQVYIPNILPSTTATYDIGSSSAKWRDIYLSGNIDFGDGAKINKDSSNRIDLQYNSDTRLKIGNANLNIKARLDPDNDNTYDIGRNSLRWKDIYISGNISDGTNSVSVANISNGLFNVINGSDIASNNELTAEQYAIFTNGKPTLIAGQSVLGTNAYCFIPNSVGMGGNRTLGMYICNASGILKIGYYSFDQNSTILNNYGYGINFVQNASTIKLDQFDVWIGKSNSADTRINNRNVIGYYLNNVYQYASNSTTTLQYETINNISISADTTFTLATAPANTYPEYKANITNTDTSNAITITLPSGTIIKGNVSISSNTFEIPADSSVELNIQNQKALVMNWGA